MTAEPAVLVLRAPQVLSYFNAGHHLAMYQLVRHLRDAFDVDVDHCDPTVETLTWKDIADRLHERDFRMVVIQNDLDGVDGLERLIRYIRALSSDTRVVTFGRLSALNPEFFRQFDLDAVVESGDPEPAVEDLYRAFDRWPTAPLPGIAVRNAGTWVPAAGPGALLDPSQWSLPDPADIPYSRYDALYSRDGRKFSGLPGRRELVVPVARGCPMGCAYCEVPTLGGRRDRRLSVQRTLDYIADCFAHASFSYVSFYAPTFTLDRRWVLALCRGLAVRGVSLDWKCCTTVHHLDEELVAAMGRAGCVRISVGLETLDPGGMSSLPPAKRKDHDDLRRLAAWCRAADIELTCFVIIGLPGTTLEGTEYTMTAVRALGGRVRPTIYASDERMSASLTVAQMGDLNRQLLASGSDMSPEQRRHAYRLAFSADTLTRALDPVRLDDDLHP